MSLNQMILYYIFAFIRSTLQQGITLIKTQGLPSPIEKALINHVTIKALSHFAEYDQLKIKSSNHRSTFLPLAKIVATPHLRNHAPMPLSLSLSPHGDGKACWPCIQNLISKSTPAFVANC